MILGAIALASTGIALIAYKTVSFIALFVNAHACNVPICIHSIVSLASLTFKLISFHLHELITVPKQRRWQS